MNSSDNPSDIYHSSEVVYWMEYMDGRNACKCGTAGAKTATVQT